MILPPAVVISKSRDVESELTVAVLFKVTVVFAASASIMTSPFKVTGPVIATAPPAVAAVVISPVRFIPPVPIKVTEARLLAEPEFAPTLPPSVITALPLPLSSRISVSSPL